MQSYTPCIAVFVSLTVLIHAQTVINVRRNAGEVLETQVRTVPDIVTGCYLDTPHGETLEFKPNNGSDEKFQLRSNSFSECQITIRNLDNNDNGVWRIHYENATGDGNSESYNLTVHVEESIEEIEDGIDWLEQINHITRTGAHIDITLSKIAYDEECSLLTSDNKIIESTDTDEIPGIVFKKRSNFVSCRVTIGPIDESFLGGWTLCGKHVGQEIQHQRCQPINIAWSNNNPSGSNWMTEARPVFSHPVHFNGSISPGVSSSGTVTCHVITPNGEDLVLTTQSNYPHLKLEGNGCNVKIGPIDETLLGDWVIYGKFQSFVGLNEIRQPINLFLYDEENPYNQAYNVTKIASPDRIVNIGNILTVDVSSIGNLDRCYYMTPIGKKYYLNKNSNNENGVSFIDANSGRDCRISIGPITKELLGSWKLIGEFSNNGLFTRIEKYFEIIKEDPANPIQDDNREVEMITPENINTRLGRSHRIVIRSNSFLTPESCHIRTPDGLQYVIMDGFNLPGVEVTKESSVACGVTVTILTEDFIGDWVLISRDTRFSTDLIERRLPFNIYVEEFVDALPQELTVTEGNNVHVRLAKPTLHYTTCKLIGSDAKEILTSVADELNVDTCGFIVPNINKTNAGRWEIDFGTKIVYRAPIEVTVTARWEPLQANLTWTIGRPLDVLIGPEDAIYCKLINPHDGIVFENFGRCNIKIDKVSMEYNGVWTMFVGLPGRVLTDEYQFVVSVINADSKPEVITSVEKVSPSVFLSCSVSSQYNISACKFRDPSGRILLASHGVGEDRYSFHGKRISFESDVVEHNCGLRITNPLARDLGLWRCSMESEGDDTYYGFLTVLCPWAMQDPEVTASVVSEPVLRAEREEFRSVEGDSLTMSCSVQSTIRYCYFRAQNGTVFNVGPGNTAGLEYVGAGFDAGECGIRIPNLHVNDTGIWSCHVGLMDSASEQRARINVEVQELMKVDQFVKDQWLIVFGHVYESQPLEYCRFVRIDGFGFISDQTDQYSDVSSPSTGHCSLRVRNPTMLDLHPWTIVAKLQGRDGEISAVTNHSIQPDVPSFGSGYLGMAIFWVALIVLSSLALFLAGLLYPKKNREWASEKAASIRRSFRNSFRKKPSPTLDTPVVA